MIIKFLQKINYEAILMLPSIIWIYSVFLNGGFGKSQIGFYHSVAVGIFFISSICATSILIEKRKKKKTAIFYKEHEAEIRSRFMNQ